MVDALTLFTLVSEELGARCLQERGSGKAGKIQTIKSIMRIRPRVCPVRLMSLP